MVRSPVGKVTPQALAPPPLPSGSILPGAVLGVMGGGQLGAMFAMAAKRMGYRVEAISDSDTVASPMRASIGPSTSIDARILRTSS